MIDVCEGRDLGEKTKKIIRERMNFRERDSQLDKLPSNVRSIPFYFPLVHFVGKDVIIL